MNQNSNSRWARTGAVVGLVATLTGALVIPLNFYRQSPDLPGFWFWLVLGVGAGIVSGALFWHHPERDDGRNDRRPRTVSLLELRSLAGKQQERLALEIQILVQRSQKLEMELLPHYSGGHDPDEYFPTEAESDAVATQLDATQSRLLQLRKRIKQVAAGNQGKNVRLDRLWVELLREELDLRT
jgi:hypothetical protein